jgi:phosphatidylserine/phosphatidylglycerophosphate/cardiolipin synthase-like enzyme
MLIIELFALLATIAALFIWNRAESRADIRHMDNKLDSMRNLVEAIKEDTRSIHLEMKDFHDRLCQIERSRK